MNNPREYIFNKYVHQLFTEEGFFLTAVEPLHAERFMFLMYSISEFVL